MSLGGSTADVRHAMGGTYGHGLQTCRSRQRSVLEFVEDRRRVTHDELFDFVNETACPAGHELHMATLMRGLVVSREDGVLGLGRDGVDWLTDAGQPTPDWSASIAAGVPALRAWQEQALVSWCEHGRHGVVEAVTGTGKSRVGIEAAREALSDDYSVVVVVPSIDLVEQWVRAFREHGIRDIGRLGDGHRASLSTHRVIVGTVQSLHAAPPSRPDGKVLIVADECHRYGAEQWGKALHASYRRRLGLTATFERNDDGIRELLAYFGGSPVYRIGFRQAIDDGVVAHYDVKLLGVPLSPAERAAYDRADRIARDARTQLLAADFPAEPFGAFMHEVSKAAEDFGEDPTIVDVARRYLKAFADRVDVMTNAEAKLDVARHLAPRISSSGGAIVFTRRVEMAEEIADILQLEGVKADAIHSDLSRGDREDRLSRLKAGALKALVAPTVLDEGIDVPAIDLAVVMGGSRSRRQMIQRMGRVLRLKRDGRKATFVVVYAESTAEDLSETDGAEGCLDLIVESADSVEPLMLEDGHVVPSSLVFSRPAAVAATQSPQPVNDANDEDAELVDVDPRAIDPDQVRPSAEALMAYVEAHGVSEVTAAAALRSILRDVQVVGEVTRSRRHPGAFVLRHAGFVLVVDDRQILQYVVERDDRRAWHEVHEALSAAPAPAGSARPRRETLSEATVIELLDASSILIGLKVVEAAARAFDLGDPYDEATLESCRALLAADLDQDPTIETMFGRIAVRGRRAAWTIGEHGRVVLSVKPRASRSVREAGPEADPPVEIAPPPSTAVLETPETAQQAQPTPDTVASPGSDLVDRIERLASLRQAGLLTEEEFSAAKAKLLF